MAAPKVDLLEVPSVCLEHVLAFVNVVRGWQRLRTSCRVWKDTVDSCCLSQLHVSLADAPESKAGPFLRFLRRFGRGERAARIAILECATASRLGTRDVLEALPSLAPRLVTLRLHSLVGSNARRFADAVGQLRHLEELEVANAHGVTMIPADGLRRLHTLRLYGCSGLRTAQLRRLLGGSADTLRRLCLTEARWLDSSALRVLLRGRVGPPPLEELILVRSGFLTSPIVDQLLRGLAPTLRWLDLSHCAGIDRTFLPGASLPLLPRLEALLLDGLNVSNGTLRNVGLGSPWLKVLSLKWCQGRTSDSAVEAIATGCPRLEACWLSGMGGLTSHGVTALLEGKVGEEGREGRRSLRVLGLDSCRGVDRALRQRVQRQMATPAEVGLDFDARSTEQLQQFYAQRSALQLF